MPVRKPLFDISDVDFDHVCASAEDIGRYNKHRNSAVSLDYLCYLSEDNAQGVGIRRIRDDEWWCDGHIPGDPIFPAVMMVESAAQLASYMFLARDTVSYEFVGFTRIDNTVFRRMLKPGDSMVLVCQEVKYHPKRFITDVIGYDRSTMDIVFETRVTGMPLIY